MRILIDAHVFDHSPQGSKTYLLGLYGCLIPIATHIDFYFAAYNTDKLKKEFGLSHTNVHYVKYSSNNKFYRLIFDIPKIIKSYKIDYAHYQYISPFFKTTKEIVTIHDILFNDFPQYFPLSYRLKNNFLFKKSAKRADLLLTVSEYSKQKIAQHYNIGLEKILITPNGVNKTFFEVKEHKHLPNIKAKYNLNNFVLCISRIEPRKNHISLIKAFVELKLYNSGFELVLIGKEDLVSIEMHQYLENLSYEEKSSIKFLTNIDNLEQLSFLRDASLFVYPSFAEGFGIPPLEAVAVGTPTICSNKTAMADFTFFNENHFNPDSIDELKLKINNIITNKDYELEDKKDYVRTHFNWENIAKSYLEMLNSNNI